VLLVATHRSFTAAAAAMGVSPTAMSQKIKLLERRLGVVLFQRTTRRVALTEAGASLFARLGPAVAEVEDAIAALGAHRGRPSGRLRITAPRTSVGLLAPLVARLGERYPELVVEVSLDDAFVDLVAAGFDAGIRIERQGKPITVDAPGSIVVNDIGFMVALAIEGAGLAYVPDESIAVAVAEGRLERVLESFLTPGPGYCLYFPARMQEQPKLKALVEVVKHMRDGR
jgi:DNA-binding transcriptional LysR family regulator